MKGSSLVLIRLNLEITISLRSPAVLHFQAKLPQKTRFGIAPRGSSCQRGVFDLHSSGYISEDSR